jgi:putative membrane protein
MTHLTNEDLTRISDAIRAAERRTSGEIVVVVDRIAASYKSVPVIVALILSLLVPFPLIAWTTFSAARVFTIQLTLALIFLSTFLWAGWNGAFVPRFLRRRRAHDVAAREFMVRGLSRTRDRTGILIYVALAERYAEVLADTGISDRVDDSQWRLIIDDLTDATADDRLADGLVLAVGKAGDLLARDFPPRERDEDELSDKVILI